MTTTEDIRWNVEVRPDVFEDVGAGRFTISSCGAVIFFDSNDNNDATPVIAYAPGMWRTVSR